jgi:phosphatidylcholine synthase
MKTDDLWFRGFPATWNIIVLYLFILRPPWMVSAAFLLGATALMFAPVVFVHPLRVVKLRSLTIAMSFAWFVLAAIAIVENLQPSAWVVWGLIATVAYFLAMPLLRYSPWADD